MLLLSLVLFAADDFSNEARLAAVQATVRVTGGKTQGSGVILGQKDGAVYVLTALHIVDGAKNKVEAATFSRDSYPRAAATYPAQLIARAEKQDLALLRLDTKDVMPAIGRLCPAKQIPEGKNFSGLAVGCAGGALLEPKPRIVTVVRATRVRGGEQVRMLAWEIALAQPEGYSGGPLFDRQGRVLGIANLVSDGLGYYCHAEEIRAFLAAEDLKWLAGD